MLGFKAFEAAQNTLAGVELMHMLKTGQMVVEEGEEYPHFGRTVLCSGCLITSSAKLTTPWLKIWDRIQTSGPCSKRS